MPAQPTNDDAMHPASLRGGRQRRRSLDSLGTADGLSARTSVSSRSGISSATDTRYRLSMEIDFSPRSTSPMNLPDRPARSASRPWLRPRCLRRARTRCPKNFLTCWTARSLMVRSPPRAEPEPDAMGRSAADCTATYDACQSTAAGVIGQDGRRLVPPPPPRQARAEPLDGRRLLGRDERRDTVPATYLKIAHAQHPLAQREPERRQGDAEEGLEVGGGHRLSPPAFGAGWSMPSHVEPPIRSH